MYPLLDRGPWLLASVPSLLNLARHLDRQGRPVLFLRVFPDQQSFRVPRRPRVRPQPQHLLLPLPRVRRRFRIRLLRLRRRRRNRLLCRRRRFLPQRLPSNRLLQPLVLLPPQRRKRR